MICYGRSIPSIAEQLYGGRDDMTDEQKTKGAQRVFDSVMNSFPGLRNLMTESQDMARQLGYVTTILGRRRHLPDMQLPEFDFKAMPGYVNPDIDPLDISTLSNSAEIPDRIVKQLKKEFAGYKYYGQIAKRTKELYEQNIRVVNNRAKINDATRQCVNCVSTDTQILTASGWKYYNEVENGEKIISYNPDKKCLEEDIVQAIHLDSHLQRAYAIQTPYLSAVCTDAHRWVTDDGLSESFCITSDMRAMQGVGIVQTGEWVTAPPETKFSEGVLNDIRDLGRFEATHLSGSYTKKMLMSEQFKQFLSALGEGLTYDFLFQMPQLLRQAFVSSFIDAYGSDERFVDSSPERLRMIQTALFMCGRLSVLTEGRSHSCLTLLPRDVRKTTVVPSQIHETETEGVWCVTTNNGTWVARKDGTVYITGNSRIQGRQPQLPLSI